MTDMINGAFMEDLSEVLNSATGDQRRRKTFYEIDTEFQKMTASLLKNFNSMASLMPFLRASLRAVALDKHHPVHGQEPRLTCFFSCTVTSTGFCWGSRAVIPLEVNMTVSAGGPIFCFVVTMTVVKSVSDGPRD
jgi:hypothetical protein